MLDYFLDTKSNNLDTQRRSRLLNILILSVGFITILLALATVSGLGIDPEEINLILLICLITFIGNVIILFINKYVSSPLAAWIFLSLLILIFVFSDTPEEVTGGRTLFIFTIPILMASVILSPSSSFIFAAVIGIILNIVAHYAQLEAVIIIPVFVFFIIALVSWLAASSLERALRELRVINEELDQRVEERTAELQVANTQLQQEIAERERINRELQIARDQALEANRFKTEMMAKVSHELRTPLGAILGYAEMLENGFYGELTEKSRATVQKIIERNQGLSRLVGDLLEQAQFEQGKPQLNVVDFSLRDLVDDVCALLEPTAKAKGIYFEAEVDDNLQDSMCGDPDRLGQIMINLGGNAIKFTNAGHVKLNLQKLDEARWQIEVSDTGAGIPASEHGRIFDAFRQVDGSATRDHAGFGLGLSIVKELTDIMGGKITVDSEPGRGSTFNVILPLLVEEKAV